MFVLDERYELIRLLGEGGLGTVYVAKDLETGEDCVVKMASFSLDVHDFHDFFYARETLRREYLKLATLPPHPNCIRVLGVGGYYYVMEMVKGSHLFSPNQKVVDKGTQTWTFSVMYQVFEALHHYVSNGQVHLDLKPSNIMLEGVNGTTRVVLIDPLITHEDVDLFVGTPEYSAPEFMGDKSGETHQADLYAAGLLFYELLMGKRPWLHDDPVELWQSRKVPWTYPSLDGCWPKPVIDLIDQLLLPEPGNRPSSAKECLDRLKPYVNGNMVI